MNLRWRFSGGIIFSLSFHALLISTLIYAYPGIKNKSDRILKGIPLFLDEKKLASNSNFENTEKDLKFLLTEKSIFPDLIIIKNKKKQLTRTKKNTIPNPQHTLSKILTQVEKYPGRVKIELNSNKKLSEPVISLLSLLPSAGMKRKKQENSSFFVANEVNSISSFKSNELKNYLNELSEFLSESWEVPIHLKESQVTVEIIFEINKNGKILSWELQESESKPLHSSVNNLMKNLQFLPALPNSYPENYYIFGVRFSPKILQKKYAGKN